MTNFHKRVWYLLFVWLFAGGVACTELTSTLPGALQGVVKKTGSEPAEGALVYTNIGGQSYSTLSGSDGFFSLAIPVQIDSHICITAWSPSSSSAGHVSYNQVTLSDSPQFNIGTLGALGCTFGDGSSGSIICPKSDVPDITNKVSTEAPLDIATDRNLWILAPTGEFDSLFINGEPTGDHYGFQVRIPGINLTIGSNDLVFDASDPESPRTLTLTKQDQDGIKRNVPAIGTLAVDYQGPGNPAQAVFSNIQVLTDGNPEPQPVAVLTRIAGIPLNAATLPPEDKLPLYNEPGKDCTPVAPPPPDDDDNIEIHYSVQTPLEDWDEKLAVTRGTSGTSATFSISNVQVGERMASFFFDFIFLPALYTLLEDTDPDFSITVDNNLGATLEESEIIVPATLVIAWDDTEKITLWQLASIETLKFANLDVDIGDLLAFTQTNSKFYSVNDDGSGELNSGKTLTVNLDFNDVLVPFQADPEPPPPGINGP